MHLFFLFVWVGPLGAGVGTFFETDLWFGGSTRGACNETGQMGQRFCDVSTWLYVSFFLNLGRFARIGWGGIVLVFKNARLTSPILVPTTTTPSSKRWIFFPFPWILFFFQICCSNITPV